MATNYTPGAPGDATPNSTGTKKKKQTSGSAKKQTTTRKQTTVQQGTPRWWARELLQRLGAPITAANVKAIVAWEAAEGGNWNNSAAFNPLNTTQPMPGSGTMNGAGVRVYSSWEQGLDATVQTLRNGFYGNILDALNGGRNAGAVVNAVVNSKWGTHNISLDNATYYAGVTGAGGGAGPQASNAQLESYIKQNYGDVAAFLDIPEIRNLLFQAARQGWDSTRLQGALEGTSWWQTHGVALRQAIATQKTDPATWGQQVANQAGDVSILAHNLGINLSSAEAQTIAEHSLMYGWDNNLIQQAIGAHFQYVKGQSYQGTAGSTIDTLRGLANDYLVPMSDQRLQNWTQQVLEGKTTADGFKDTLIQQAASLFPQFTKELQGGQTMQQIVDPYRQLAAQTLEVDPATIDFTKPKWRTAIDQVNPDNNQRHAMSLSDWQTYMMTNDSYGYDHTQGALQQAAQLVSGLKQRMGFE